MRTVYRALLLLLAAIAFTLPLLLYTEIGLRVTIALAEKLSGGGLSVQGSSGTLVGPLQLRGIAYDGGDLTLSIGSLDLDWTPTRLIDDLVLVNSAAVTALEVTVAEGGSASGEAATMPARLPFDVEFRDLVLIDPVVRNGADSFALSRLNGSLKSHEKRELAITLEALRERSRLHVDGQIGLSDTLSMALNTSWSHPLSADRLLRGAGTISGGLEQLQFSHNISGDFTLQVEGRVLTPLVQPEVELEFEASGISGLLDGVPIDSERTQGRVALRVAADKWYLDSDLAVTVPEFPDLQLALTAEGDSQTISAQRLKLDGLGGTLQGTAELTLDPHLSWQTTLSATHINPGEHWPQWPGRLDGEFLLAGRDGDGAPSLSVTVKELTGRLRELPVEAALDLKLVGDSLSIRQMELRSATSRLTAQGAVTLGDWDATSQESKTLFWEIHSANLGELLPDLVGELHADGSLIGSGRSRKISADLNGREIRYQGTSFGVIAGEAALSFADEPELNVHLESTGIAASGTIWDSLRLDLTSSGTEHRLETRLVGEAMQLEAMAIGDFTSPERWQGELRQLSVAGTHIGSWSLEAPLSISRSGYQFAAGGGCLAMPASPVDGGEPARLCGEYTPAEDASGRAGVTVTRVPLELIAPMLPNGLEVSGTTDGQLALQHNGDSLESAQIEMTIAGGELTFSVNGAAQTASLAGSRLQLNRDREGLHGEIQIHAEELGHAEGSVQLPGWSELKPLHDDQTVVARLVADSDALQLLTLVEPRLAAAQGSLELEVGVSGTLGLIRSSGRLKLVDAEVEIPDLGLAIKEIELTAHTPQDNEIAVTGRMRSGEGWLKLDSTLRLEPEISLEAHAVGAQIEVVNTPEIWVVATPEITLQVGSGETHVSGELGIAQARIQPRSLPESVVRESSDVIIRQSGRDRDEVPRTSAELLLKLGDRVHLDAFGLKGRLHGDLQLVVDPGKPIIGVGRLSIDDGSYRAYGQDLEITTGDALFAHSPVSNPALDLRAVRRVGEIEAGVAVTGTLNDPELALFSSPAMTQSDTLSYLLFGRASRDLGSGEQRDTVDQARRAAAVGAGQYLAAEVGRRLGFNEFALETGESQQELALKIGTYLSPKVYLQYISGLRAAADKIRVRYQLSDRLQIQAESGEEHGVDLFYTIER